MLMVLNEEKQKMKQRSLFGGIIKDNTKSYCIYKNPDRDFESVAVLFMRKAKLESKTKSWLLRRIGFGRKPKQTRKRLKSSYILCLKIPYLLFYSLII